MGGYCRPFLSFSVWSKNINFGECHPYVIRIAGKVVCTSQSMQLLTSEVSEPSICAFDSRSVSLHARRGIVSEEMLETYRLLYT